MWENITGCRHNEQPLRKQADRSMTTKEAGQAGAKNRIKEKKKKVELLDVNPLPSTRQEGVSFFSPDRFLSPPSPSLSSSPSPSSPPSSPPSSEQPRQDGIAPVHTAPDLRRRMNEGKRHKVNRRQEAEDTSRPIDEDIGIDSCFFFLFPFLSDFSNDDVTVHRPFRSTNRNGHAIQGGCGDGMKRPSVKTKKTKRRMAFPRL